MDRITMTRKDFQLIADSVKETIEKTEGQSDSLHRYGQRKGIRSLAHALANRLEKDNPRFNRERFLEACGL